MAKRKKAKKPAPVMCSETSVSTGEPCGNRVKAGESMCASHLKLAKRPSKLLTAMPKIEEALEIGNSREGAAAYAGIGSSTFYSWMERGEADVEQDERTPYREFVETVTRAEGFAEQTLVAEIRRSAKGFVDPETRERRGHDWKAAAFLLERRHPDRWGQKQTIKLPGFVPRREVDVPLDQERLDEVAEILRNTGALPTEAS